MEKTPAVKKHLFFEGMSNDHLEEILEVHHVKSFEAGETVIAEGEPANECYLVLKGKIHVLTEKFESHEDERPELIPIQILGPGQLLGWSWLVPPHKWSMTAEAVEPSEVLVLDGEKIRQKCEKDPALGFDLLKRIIAVMSERLLLTRLHLALHDGQPFDQCEGG